MLIMLSIVQVMFAVGTLPVINRHIQNRDVGESWGAFVAFLLFAMTAYFLFMEGMQ